MDVTYDHERFSKYQDRLVDLLLKTIYGSLVESGIADPQLLSSATHATAFGIAALIDGCTNTSIDDDQFTPFLTFKVPDMEAALHGEGSWMHECLDEDAIDAMCGLPAAF
jgi:hypothetical protein